MEPIETCGQSVNDIEFAGWVPTITGHLSFSLIGQAGSAPGAIAANGHRDVNGRMERQVVVVQRRVTQDLPFTFQPIPKLLPQMSADFIMVGSSQEASIPSRLPREHGGPIECYPDRVGVIAGTITVIPYYDERWAQDYACELVSSIRIDVAQLGDNSPRGATKDIAPLLDSINHRLAQAREVEIGRLRAKFELYRSGEFRLYVDRSDFPDITSAQDFDDAADVFFGAFANQIYYFAKDSAHRHYHHDRRADNLLPMKRIVDGNDEYWRRETLWSLTRAVLEVRRRNNLPSYQRATGLIAYADAFQSLLAQIKRMPEDRNSHVLSELPTYDYRHTRYSIESKMAELEWSNQFMSNAWALMITSLIAAAALWIEAVHVTREICGASGRGCEIPAVAADIVSWMIRNPVSIGAWLLLLAICYLQFARDSLRSIPILRLYTALVATWPLALGATISRAIRRVAPVAGDLVGAMAAMAFPLFVGGTWLWLLGRFSGFW